MKMLREDIKIFYVGVDEFRATCSFNAMTDEWPSTIHHDGKDYKFESQEVMEDWMIGNYAGHARYSLM